MKSETCPKAEAREERWRIRVINYRMDAENEETKLAIVDANYLQTHYKVIITSRLKHNEIPKISKYIRKYRFQRKPM